jgi:hypothetical protein
VSLSWTMDALTGSQNLVAEFFWRFFYMSMTSDVIGHWGLVQPQSLLSGDQRMRLKVPILQSPGRFLLQPSYFLQE